MPLLIEERSDGGDGLFGGLLRPVWRFFAGFDWLQIAGALVLMGFGLVFVRSTGIQTGNPDSWKQHLIWILFGSGLFFIMSYFDYRYLKVLSPLLYFGGVLLLVLVLFSPPINNARSWLSIPGSGLRIQPSEAGKLGTIVALSALLVSPHFNIRKIRHLLLAAAVAGLPMYLILIEPDFGSSFVLIPILFCMLFAAGMSRKLVLGILAAMVILVPLIVLNEIYEVRPMLKPYQRARITTFLDPDIDPHGAGYNLRQARLAVGSGGWLGKGVGAGTLSGLGYLPQTVTNNDFIFSVIAEESGFAGVLLLLTAELVVVLSCLRIAYLTDDPFGRYIAVGMTALLFCHCYINIGMCIGLAPISGLPLPLVSYGGSFMAMNLGSLGILQSIYRYRKECEI
ncbi:MAG: FtsW/RodA/SpoVE family cell cycle protein [Victivallaceae bacterium]|nr:FtsW/RodA/SpoVE family cell cycle protein [Victivallaceae bacterium]